MSEMQGRRIPIVNDKMPQEGFEFLMEHHWLPGDYCGPIVGYTGDKPAVFYVLPNCQPDEYGFYRRHHVTSPPHTFRECPDGSLEIRNSILHRGYLDDSQPHGEWHGFLNEGHRWTW